MAIAYMKEIVPMYFRGASLLLFADERDKDIARKACKKTSAGLMLIFTVSLAIASPANAKSSYAEDINLPPCDVHIKSGESLSTANGSGQVFCVHPGSYNGAEITASGSASSPRVLRYYNPNNPTDTRHPVKMSSSERATVRGCLTLNGSHWVISGFAFFMEDGGRLINTEGGRHITLDRVLVEGGGGGAGQVRIETDSVLQKSVLRNTAGQTSGGDYHCIVVGGGSDNVKVAGNEIYNCAGDGLQIHPGTSTNILIADNDLYQTSGFAKNFTEQALDFKNDSGNTVSTGVRIESNRIWSFKNDDQGVNNTAIIFTRRDNSQGVWKITDNVFFDNPRGIHGGGRSNPDHFSIVNNIFYNNGDPLIFRYFSDTEVYHNTFVGNDTWVLDSGGGVATNIDILCNVLDSNAGYDPLGSGTVVDYNAYYNSSRYAAPGTNDIVFANAASANNGEFCYERKRWTGPETHCIPNVVTTASSPHKGMCAHARVGSRSDIGMDNITFSNLDAGASFDELLSGEGSGSLGKRPTKPSRVKLEIKN